MLLKCLLWDDDSSHPITHCDGFIFLDQWLWSLLEQHCTMTLHFKDQIRWLVTRREKSQNFMHVRTSFNQSLSIAVLLNWKKLQSLQHRESCLMETSNCRDYWSRNTIVSKGLPFSKSNIKIWNQRLNTCAPIDRTVIVSGAWKYNGKHELSWDSVYFSVTRHIITADRFLLTCLNQGHKRVWYLKWSFTLLEL